MDFALSSRHEEIRQIAARVAREAVAPRAAEVDRTGAYPHDYVDAFREAGLLGLAIPREHGGSGDGTLGLCLAVEEAAKYCNSAALILLTTRLATAAISMAGTPQQQRRYVPGVATGQLKGCFALTEPDAGSDSAAIATTAVRDGDEYVLDGTKLWAGQATVADFAMVVAKTNPAAGARGISVFLVDLPNPGFHIVRELPKMGVLGVPVVEIALRGCRVPASALLGEENRGFHLVMRHLNVVRPLVAARGVGLAAGATSYALAYARKRRTFGQRLIDHQAIQFKLAELAMQIEAARLLTYRAAWLVDRGGSDREIAHYLSMAKATASEVAVRAAEEALQILGGYGYLKDYPTERYYRDALPPALNGIRCTMASADPRAASLYIRNGMIPQWPHYCLRADQPALDSTAVGGIETIEAEPQDAEMIRWDAEIGGRPRPQEHAFWAREERGVPLWFRRRNTTIGYGYVRLGAGSLWYPDAATIGPVGVRDPADAGACVAAAVAWARDHAKVLRISVPGPYPALAPLLSARFRITYVETFLSAAPQPFFDPRCYLASESTLL